jgi:hypothetical protein
MRPMLNKTKEPTGEATDRQQGQKEAIKVPNATDRIGSDLSRGPFPGWLCAQTTPLSHRQSTITRGKET